MCSIVDDFLRNKLRVSISSSVYFPVDFTYSIKSSIFDTSTSDPDSTPLTTTLIKSSIFAPAVLIKLSNTVNCSRIKGFLFSTPINC